jgi:hypothetical protein
MRELDVLLIHFFEASFDALSKSEKQTFTALLELPDPELQAYLIAACVRGSRSRSAVRPDPDEPSSLGQRHRACCAYGSRAYMCWLP